MVFAALAEPFIPRAAAAIAKGIGSKTGPLPWPAKVVDSLQPGAPIAVPDLLRQDRARAVGRMERALRRREVLGSAEEDMRECPPKIAQRFNAG